MTQGKLQYFKQQNGSFQRVEETPFADLLIKGTFREMFGIIPRFVDWDGDGNMDLVITGTDKVQLFQRGVCQPSSSYCKSGVCNQRTSACTCDSFAGGQDCSLCGNFYVREMRRTNAGHVLAIMNWQVLAAGEAREGWGGNSVISDACILLRLGFFCLVTMWACYINDYEFVIVC